MTLLTVFEIATNWPDNILIEAYEHKDNAGKWASFMFMTRDGHIHKTMLSYDSFPFDSEQKALDAMNAIAQSAIEHYKSLKNPTTEQDK